MRQPGKCAINNVFWFERDGLLDCHKAVVLYRPAHVIDDQSLGVYLLVKVTRFRGGVMNVFSGI